MTIQDIGAAEHYRILREGAIPIEARWLQAVRVTGPDTRSFLQGLATQDLERTEPKRGVPTFFTNEKGRPVARGWAVVEADDYAWIVADETEPGALLKHFERFRVMEEVEFYRNIEPPYVVAGPDRDHLILAIQVPAGVVNATPLSFIVGMEWDWDWDCPPSADPRAVEAWRIGIGLPRAGIDFGTDRLVTELGEPGAISPTKGCYVGQEVVARTSQRGQVRRERIGFLFEWQGAGPLAGAEIRTADGRPVGFVTSAAREPGTERGFGMGYLSTEPEIRSSSLALAQGATTTPVDARPWPLWT